MARQITNPDGDDIIEFVEKVSDADGDYLDVTLELDAINDGSGYNQQDTDSSNLNWLSFERGPSPNPDGSRDYFITVSIDTSALTQGYQYRFELVATDRQFTDSRTVELTVNA